MCGIGLYRYRQALWIAVVGCAIVVSVVVFTTRSEHSGPTKARADIQRSTSQNPAEAEVAATREITPSPVIESNPKFFFGAGDGSSWVLRRTASAMNPYEGSAPSGTPSRAACATKTRPG